MACQVSQCCCGCTLRTGTLTIGIISFVVYIINFATTLDVLINIGDINGVYTTSAVFTGLGLALATCLLLGVWRNNSTLVKVWVWVNVLLQVANIALAITMVVVSASITVAVIFFLNIALNVYFIVVVRSFGLELDGQLA